MTELTLTCDAWSLIKKSSSFPPDVAARVQNFVSSEYKVVIQSILENFHKLEIKQLVSDKENLRILSSVVLQAEHDLNINCTGSCLHLFESSYWLDVLSEVLKLCSRIFSFLLSFSDASIPEEFFRDTNLFCTITCNTLWCLWNIDGQSECTDFIRRHTNEINISCMNVDDNSSFVFKRDLSQKFVTFLIVVLRKIQQHEPSSSDVVRKTIKVLIHIGIECIKSGNLSSTTFAVANLFPLIPDELKLDVIREVYDIVSSFYTGDDEELAELHPTSLIILCSLWDLCYFNNNKMIPFVENAKFWKIVQFGLSHDNPLYRKQSQYLLKRVVDHYTLHGEKMSILKTGNRALFYWDPLQSEMKIFWNDFLILMEIFEEKQIHIIKPLLNKVNNIVRFVLYSPNELTVRLNASWLLLLLKRMIFHETSFASRWALEAILKLDVKESPELALEISTYFSHHFLPFLNNPDSFARSNGSALGSIPTIAAALAEFLFNCHRVLTCFKMSEFFVTDFIERMSRLSWSSEGLYYVTRAMTLLPVTPAIGEKELFLFRELILSAQNTQEHLIRGAVQCNILKIVMKMINPNEVTYDILSRFLSTLKSSECLNRSTSQWQGVVRWIADLMSADSDLNPSLLSASAALQFCNACFELLNNGNASALGQVSSECKRVVRVLVILDDAARFFRGPNADDISSNIRNNLQVLIEVVATAPRRPYLDVKKVEVALQYCTAILNQSSKQSEHTKDDLVHFVELNLIPYMNVVASYLVRKLIGSKTLEELNLFTAILNSFVRREKLRHFFITCIDVVLEPHTLVQNETMCSWIFLDMIVGFLNGEQARKVVCHEKIEELLEMPKTIGSSPDAKRMLAVAIASAWKCYSTCFEVWPSDFCTNLEVFLCFAEQTFQIVSSQAVVNVFRCLKHIIVNMKIEDDSVENCLEIGWRACMELRKNEFFRPAFTAFVDAAFQHVLMEKKPQYLLEKAEELHLLGEVSTGIFNILVKQCILVWKTEQCLSCSLRYITILCKALIFGAVHRKDQRIAQNTSAFIFNESLSVNELIESDHFADLEVRILGISYLLLLSPNSDNHSSIVANLTEHLLKNEKEITSTRSRHFANSFIHRAKTRIWQVLLMMEPFLKEESSKKVLKYIYEALMEENQQASVRFLMEWLATIILHRRKSLIHSFTDVVSRAGNHRVGCLPSFFSMMVLLSHTLSPNELETLLIDWLPSILPWCMTQHFNTRIYAQVTLKILWNISEDKGLSVIDKFSILKQCVKDSDCPGNATKLCKRLLEDFYFTVFHPINHYSLETIFYELPRLSNLTDEDWIPVDLFKQILSCDEKMKNCFIPVENFTSLKNVQPSKWILPETAGYEDATENFQKKITPWKAMVPDIQAIQDNNKKIVEADGLVIVASLIDRAPNLGGLCRTCEIFGVSEYIVGSLKYVDDQQFKNLSVSSERWVNIKEVKPHQLTVYIREMKDKGYALVGVEQTANSQNLMQYKFPKKTLLLLGNEKEGIPVEFLHLLDVCLEIPQRGIIRSLNVHVSGALLIWEYTRQHCLP